MQTKYVYQEFPKFKYHATLEPVIVQDPEEEAALGTEWADSPAGPFSSAGDDPTQAAKPAVARKKASK